MTSPAAEGVLVATAAGAVAFGAAAMAFGGRGYPDTGAAVVRF